MEKGEFVFNSENQIEKYYREEKEKAKNLLNEIERKKAVSLVNVAKKQLLQLRIEKHNLGVTHKDLSLHIRNISEKLRSMSKEKQTNIDNIRLVVQLGKSLSKLEKQASEIVSVRNSLANKEKAIFDKMNKMVDESKNKLKVSDEDSSNKLVEIENKKESLVEEAKSLLKEERTEMKLDDKVLENIGRFALFRIKILNKKLRELKKTKLDVLKQVQLLEISEEKARKKIKDAENKLNSIKKKYKKVLGLR